MRSFITAAENFIRPSSAYTDKVALNPSKSRGFKSGFSLVELLVVVVIMAIVGSAAFMMFQSTARHEANQQNLLEQTQNLRTALYTVARDVRMAGSGLQMLGLPLVQIYVPASIADSKVQRDPGWFRYVDEIEYGVRGIFGTDSGQATSSQSDTLTIFRADIETTVPLSRLSTGFTPGLSSSLLLQDSIKEGEGLSDGDIIVVTDGLWAVIVQASITPGSTSSSINVGPRFQPAEQHPEGLVLSAGSSVYNLRDIVFVTYYVDSETKTLIADYHDPTINDDDPANPNSHLVVVANNIEDFQVGYYYDAPGRTDLPAMVPTINGSLLVPGTSWVQAVQLGLVSRSRTKSLINAEARAIELMDHKASEEAGYTRRVLTEMIQLRNSNGL